MPVNETFRTLVLPFSIRKPVAHNIDEEVNNINEHLDTLASEVPSLTANWPGDWKVISHSFTVYDSRALLTILLKQKIT